MATTFEYAAAPSTGLKMMMPSTMHPGQCCCTICRGLTTYERPLFATGQTLTASDLTALQDYVAGKNRLHNRYLHGWGVVCGLAVTCNDCEGSVTIQPGYAIDPCGADIVVAQPLRFDVVQAINDCMGQGRAKTGDCDPWVPPPDPGCKDALGYWCIWLRYREVETAIAQRLTAGLGGCVTFGRATASACACASGATGNANCGCGGNCGCSGGCGGGCGCGCGRSGSPASGMAVATPNAAAPSAVTANNSCAPRRVMECFDVGIIRSCEPCAPPFEAYNRSLVSRDNQLGLLDVLIPKRSLLRNIIDCVTGDIQALQASMSQSELALAAEVATGDPATMASSSMNLDAVYAAICHLRGAVVALLSGDGFSTRCQLKKAAAAVSLAAPTEGVDRTTYLGDAKQAALDLLAAWLQMVLDCICHAFLPGCSDDPCDERVEIACVTVKSGKIIDICNHSCRRYAGAFPSTFYWMSLIPVVPLIARLLAMACCQPDLLRSNSPLVNDLTSLLKTVDPTGRLAQEVTADNFAGPRRFMATLAKFSQTPVIPALVSKLEAALAGSSVRSTGELAAPPPAATKDDIASVRGEIGELRTILARMTAAPPAPNAKAAAPKSGKAGGKVG